VAKTLVIDPRRPEPETLTLAAERLRAGELVAYPTETFYGLAADARSEEAVARVFALKGRRAEQPLPIIIDSLAALELVAEVPPLARLLAEEFWPGALSLVIPARPVLPANLTGNTGKVAARVSSHPVATALAAAFGGPITATSANRSGSTGLSSAQEVEREIGAGLALILDGGPLYARTGSTILDVTTEPPAVLRPGLVPEEIIRRFLARPRA